MELWTEYEGRTIDGAFPLKKLLLPEGRSAFFSTSNGNGDPTVIRLIASHFDEDEILARWRGVDALHHPNLLKLEKYGQLILDDTTVVYAVMEPVEANLAEVIAGQRLSVAEARQLAVSLASALQVLHANGFIHEHVEAANIFAVGEVVKLRGDCIRETPEGSAALEGRRRDIHDLGVVLLQALTQEQTLEAIGSRIALPAPFDPIVRNTLSGAWGLPEIIAALGPLEPVPPVTRVAPPPASARAVPNPTSTAQPDPVPAAAQVPALSQEPPAKNGNFTPPAARPRPQTPEGLPRFTPQKMGIAALFVVALLVVWLVLHFAHSSANQAASIEPPASKPVAAKTAPAPKTVPQALPQNTTTSGPQWRVIAYTYNRQDQAQKKTATLARTHPDLQPEVFTPTGRAPFLVTVGGPMNRDQAYAFARRAGKWGLPSDTYAQNYTGKGR